MKQKIVRVCNSKLESVIKEYENNGYYVTALTWMSCDLKFVIVFSKHNCEPNDDNDKFIRDSEELLKDWTKEWDKLNKEKPYTPPTCPWPSYPWIPNKPWEDPNPYREYWKYPNIIWCNEKPTVYYTTNTYPNNYSSKSNDTMSC